MFIPHLQQILVLTITAREDVDGYGDVKTGFEETVDESAMGTVF